MATTLILLAAAVLAVSGWTIRRCLRALVRVDQWAPPGPAPAIRFRFGIGDVLPLPPELDDVDRIALLFLSRECPLCSVVTAALPAFRRQYRRLEFVVCGREPLDHTGGARELTAPELFRDLDIAMLPYCLVVDRQRVVDLGIVNHAEHLQNLLARAA